MEAPARMKRQVSFEEEYGMDEATYNLLKASGRKAPSTISRDEVSAFESEMSKETRLPPTIPITNRRNIAKNKSAIDKRGRRELRRIFGEKILGNELAEITFEGWAKRQSIPITKTKKGRVSKRALSDAVMKKYVENLNEDIVKLSGLQAIDVIELKTNAQQIQAQSKVVPQARGLVNKKGDIELAENVGGDFEDNFIRDVNANLTGLELNPSIPLNETPAGGEDIYNNIRDDESEQKYPMSEPVLKQNEMLEGPDNEWIHADPNDDRELQNTGVRRIAENNQYTGDQKDFMQRVDANKDIRGRIEAGNLDEMLGADVPVSEGDKRQSEGRSEMGRARRFLDRDMGERKEQEELGGGMVEEEGPDMLDLRVREGGQSMREIIENEIEKRLLQPRGQWVGDRGVEADFQRQAVADREGQALRNSQSLAYLRKTGIPYRLPSRTYANNAVGLIRNSNRSMILAVNELEP